MQPSSAEANRLLAFIERIERVEQSIKDEQEARKEIYAEAKGTGYDVKVMRKLIAHRKQDADKLREEDEIFHLYARALGMFSTTPLGAYLDQQAA